MPPEARKALWTAVGKGTTLLTVRMTQPERTQLRTVQAWYGYRTESDTVRGLVRASWERAQVIGARREQAQ